MKRFSYLQFISKGTLNSKKSNLDQVLLCSDSVVERRERRKSDCPALPGRHQSRVKLPESPGPAQPGTQRIKSKSIERAVDIELSSHHLAKYPPDVRPPLSGQSVRESFL